MLARDARAMRSRAHAGPSAPAISRARQGLSCVAGRDPSAKAEQKVLVAQAGEVVDRALQADPNHFAGALLRRLQVVVPARSRNISLEG